MNANEFINKINALVGALADQRHIELVVGAKEMLSLIRLRVQNNFTLADGSFLGDYSQGYLDRRPTKKSTKINLTDTGQMWKDTGVELLEDGPQFTVVQIAPTTNRAINLFEFHVERFGPILEPSKDEIKKLKTAQINRINKLINEFL